MDYLIALLILAAGIIIGFFVGKQAKGTYKQTSADIEQQVKQLLRQQADSFMQESASSLQGLQSQLNNLQQQFAAYQTLLQPQQDAKKHKALHFFGEQADVYLTNQQQSQPRQKNKADTQPLDFSDGNSGLFTGNPEIDSAKSQS